MQGILVANPGYSVETAEDINLSLKTDFTLLKSIKYGTAVFSGGSSTIAHNYGYIPQFIVFGLAEDGGSNYIMFANSNQYWYPDSFAVGDWIKARADSTNLYLTAGSAHGTSITSAYYYIFVEQL